MQTDLASKPGKKHLGFTPQFSMVSGRLVGSLLAPKLFRVWGLNFSGWVVSDMKNQRGEQQTYE